MAAVFALALAAQAPALSSAAERDREAEIVVTARRNGEVLERCLREGCSPVEDIQASIAVAEHQFVSGEYEKARTTLYRSISRNKGHRKQFPAAVASLYEAASNINLHYGDERSYRHQVASRVQIIRDSTAEGSPGQVVATALLGDMWLALDDRKQAERTYRSAASLAAATGHPKLAAFLHLRRASAKLTNRDFGGADALLREVAVGPFAADPGVRELLLSLQLRSASARKEAPEVDAALRELAALPASLTPVLLYAEPLRISPERIAEAYDYQLGATPRSKPIISEQLRWMDVGFLIGGDGRTREIEVLRGAMSNERVTAVLKHIASRRYTPFAAPEGAIGTYRVERYTLRSGFGSPTGSLIRRREGAPQLQVIDITRTAPAPPASDG